MSDPDKRSAYDRFGLEGMKDGGGFGGFPDMDIFSSFFGTRAHRGPRKTNDVRYVLECTLEEIYNGCEKKFKIRRNVLCTACDATGSKDRRPPEKCSGCRGTGMKIIERRTATMVQQFHTTCDECQGEGVVISSQNRCSKCQGAKVVKETKTVVVEVDKGVPEGHIITLSGLSDEAPGMVTGDLIFQIKVKPHKVFKLGGRRSHDLFMEMEINLADALTGFETTIEHLDGRILYIKHHDIIKPNEIKEIREEGMPIYSRTWDRGSLFIKFNIKFPKLSESQKKQIKKMGLKCLPPVTVKPDYVSVSLYDVDENKANYDNERMDEEEDEDYDRRGGGSRVDCVQS